MDNSFFPRTWRSKEVKTTKEEKQLPLGKYDLLRIERKFVSTITYFIQGIFNYEKIKVALTKKDPKSKSITAYSSGKLEEANGHTKFHFASKLFNDQFYEFSVTNIPATTDNRHIQVFFAVLMQYISAFYESIQKTLPIEDGRLKASPSFVAKADIWLYNIERTIIIEYIFNLFNSYNEDYSNPFKLTPNILRYDLDLINRILDFAQELSSKKVENKEIYCGFIFHDNESEVRINSVKSFKFQNQFDFGDFGQLKNYLEISNGQNLFFNVTKDKVTHLFITRDKLNEIHLNPIGDGKTFQNRPLILSIQGNGKIFFLEGRSDHNKILLQIINSKPVIRDNGFIQKFIFDNLKEFVTANDGQIEVFSKWIMSLSQKKHGTSLIFSTITSAVEEKLVKTVKISFERNDFLRQENLRHDLSLLDSIVNPDGAVILGKDLIPSHISTILPIGQSATGTSGGARHNSVSNFTREFKCLGIVISEDGPITVFKDGEKLIKF
jgi:hypothetical protein